MSLNAAEIKNTLQETLSALREATARLQEGLMRADPEAIMASVIAQTEALDRMGSSVQLDRDEALVEQFRPLVREIVIMNEHNQALSRAGIRALRSVQRSLLPRSQYGPDGEAEVELQGISVSASA
jgi:hypothetical protein